MNGAVQEAQSFASVLTANGDTTWYSATNGTAWETGLLTRTSASVYARTTIYASSNSGATVNFSTGIVDVFVDLPASRIASKPILMAFTGQSNDANTPAYSWTPPPNLFLLNWDGDATHVGTAFAAPSSTTIGRCIQFAAEKAWANPTRSVYVAVISIAGLVIDNWLPAPPTYDMYAAFKANVEEMLTLTGATKLDVMGWGQGEQDLGTASATYITKFESVQTRLKAETWFDFGTYVNIFGVSSSAISAGGPACDTMNNAFAYLASSEPQRRVFVPVGTIPAANWDLVSGPPYVHMLASGYVLAGKMAARLHQFGAGHNPRNMVVDVATGYVGVGKLPTTNQFDVSGVINAEGLSKGAGFATTGLPSAVASLDVSGQTEIMLNGASLALPTLRGMVMISEVTLSGDSGVYLVGQGSATLIAATPGTFWVAPTTTPGAGHGSISWDGVSGYKIYNNAGGTRQFAITQLKNS